MKGTSSFRNYRSDRLSDKDLEDIRGMIWECFGEFSEMITSTNTRPEIEYLDTDEVAG